MEVKISNKRYILIGVLAVLLLSLVGMTLAYYFSRSVSNEKTIRTSNINIDYTEGASVVNLSSNDSPILDEEYQTKASRLNFTLRNTGSLNALVTMKMNVTYNNVSGSTSLADYKWLLEYDGSLVAQGDFSSKDAEITMLENVSFNKPVTANNVTTYDSKSYTLYVWVSETWQDQSALANTGLSIKINTESSPVK